MCPRTHEDATMPVALHYWLNERIGLLSLFDLDEEERTNFRALKRFKALISCRAQTNSFRKKEKGWKYYGDHPSKTRRRIGA